MYSKSRHRNFWKCNMCKIAPPIMNSPSEIVSLRLSLMPSWVWRWEGLVLPFSKEALIL